MLNGRQLGDNGGILPISDNLSIKPLLSKKKKNALPYVWKVAVESSLVCMFGHLQNICVVSEMPKTEMEGSPNFSSREAAMLSNPPETWNF